MLFQSSKRFLDRQPGTAFILSFWNGIRLWQNIFPCSPHMPFASIAPCSKPGLCYRSLAIGCYHKYTTSQIVFFNLLILQNHSVYPVLNHIQNSRMICGNNKHAIAHCFQDADWLSFVGISCGENKDISLFRRSRFSLPDMIPCYVTTSCRLSSLFCIFVAIQ